MTQSDVRTRLETAGLLAEAMAHEINTPLAAARDSLAFLRESFLDLCEIAVGGDQAELEYLVTEVPRVLEEAVAAMDRVARVVKSAKDLADPNIDKRVVDDVVDLGELRVRLSSSAGATDAAR
jgi:signal transduction histidine kinase